VRWVTFLFSTSVVAGWVEPRKEIGEKKRKYFIHTTNNCVTCYTPSAAGGGRGAPLLLVRFLSVVRKRRVYESELQPRHPSHRKAVRQHLRIIDIREERTTVDTFYNGPRLELGFGYSADARRSLVVHILVVRQESALSRSGEGLYAHPALNAANTAQFLISLLLPLGNQAT